MRCADLRARLKHAVEDGAAAAVCSSWHQAWRETEDDRRWLRATELAEPAFDMDDDVDHRLTWVAHPSGRWLAIPDLRSLAYRIVDPSMNVLRTHDFRAMVRCFTARY